MQKPKRKKTGRLGRVSLILPLVVFMLVVGLLPKKAEMSLAGSDTVLKGGGILAFGGAHKGTLSFHRRRSSSERKPLFSKRSSPPKQEARIVKSGSSKSSKYASVSKVASSRKSSSSSQSSKPKEITVAKSSVAYEKVRLGEKKMKWKYVTADVRRQIDHAHITGGRWRYIVVHNSATTKGNAKAFDRYHREVKGMPNGMAYHFVIGNGSYTKDGQIEIGNRWTKQLQGGHLRSYAQNQIAIGICLVGDFDTQRVGGTQLEALDELVNYLQAKVGKAIVTTHRRINIRPTTCPGRYFPDTQVMTAFNR